MNINGRNTLACLDRIERDSSTMKVYPLPHMFVVKVRRTLSSPLSSLLSPLPPLSTHDHP